MVGTIAELRDGSQQPFRPRIRVTPMVTEAAERALVRRFIAPEI
jgi:hypothetical protein